MSGLRRVRRVIRMVGLGLMVAAISQELAKPEAERQWNGTVLGFVPYDFRPPTWERIRDAYWNPRSGRLFSARVLGVGWAVNLYRLRELARQGYEALAGGNVRPPVRIGSLRPPSDRAGKARAGSAKPETEPAETSAGEGPSTA